MAVAISGGISSAMVGVAISASFMPPMTSAGLNLVLGLYHALGPFPKAGVPAYKGFEIVGYSLLLVCGARECRPRQTRLTILLVLQFVINFIVIVLVSLGVFHIKSVQPLRHIAHSMLLLPCA